MGVNEFGGDIVGRNKILVTLKGSKELNDEKKEEKITRSVIMIAEVSN